MSPRRLRTLLIALSLAGLASVIGIALFLIRADNVPLFHRVTDLAVHFGAIDRPKYFGASSLPYDDTPNDNLGIVTIDEFSVGNAKAGLGQFPFPRSVYGRALERLAAAGAKTVAFDVIFVDPGDAAQNEAFARGMHRVPTVLADVIDTTTAGRIGVQPPVPALKNAAAAVGFTSTDRPGGYFIGQPVEIDTGATGTNANARLLSEAAAATQTFTGKPFDKSSVPTTDGRLILLTPELLALQGVNSQGAGVEYHVVNFAGGSVIPFASVLTDTIPQLREFAKGRLIYIGATAQGLGDFVNTPRYGSMPGLFANARLADQLMRGLYIRSAPDWLNIALMIVFPLLIALALTYLRPGAGIALALLATAIYIWVNLALFVNTLIWVDLVHVAISMVLATVFVASYRILIEGAQRRVVTELFGMHVSPAVVGDILKQDDPRAQLALQGKKVKATIFYSDIRGFTSMSETMTPEEIYAQLNEYFSAMCDIIFEYGGFVDKFIGDCIMAVFSAPYPRPDDAQRAVIAAVKQQELLAEMGKKWAQQGKKVFTVGMGLNTGDVVMGNLGAKLRMNYTVIGDNVNVAARLYNVAKGGEIIISESTYDEVKDFVEVEDRATVPVKGKIEPIRIYNVTRVKTAAPALK